MGFGGLLAQAGLAGAAEGVGAWGRELDDAQTRSNLLSHAGQQQMSLADHENQLAIDRAKAVAQDARDYDAQQRQLRADVAARAHDDWTAANSGQTPTPYQSAMISANALTRAGFAKEGAELAHAGLYIGTGDWRQGQAANMGQPNSLVPVQANLYSK